MMRLVIILLFAHFYFQSMAQPLNRYDVLITEIMVDPDPAVGLPNAEYVELKNRTTKPVNLQGWRLATPSARSGALPQFILQPDSFVLVTTPSQQMSLAAFGTTISVASFPALVNTGTTISLTSADNRIIHAVAYSDEWYNNDAKAKGGWSLEMMDEANPCTGASNWTASTDPKGGTPGKKNAVAASNRDETPPALVNATVINPTTLLINFSEPLDSNSAVAFANYRLQPALAIVAVNALNPMLQQVELTLAAPLDTNTLYTLTVLEVVDCSGNVLGIRNKLPIGRPQPIETGDIVINEILFNPKPSGTDYMELYNRSEKVIDMGTLYIANRSGSGQVANARKILQNPFYAFPGDYIVLTENRAILFKQYFVPNADAALQVSSLPSMPDKEGKVVLLNGQNVVIDEVQYADDWHHALIADKEGVALERIDPNGPSLDKNNWHSAATSVGYGTPTYKNSQYKQIFTEAYILVAPKTFSPDGDGFDDKTNIAYLTATTGFVANVTIYDAAGRAVRQLVKNNLLAQKGTWTWDGLDDRGQRLPIGTYIIHTTLFNTKGEKKHFKNTVVLARRL